MATLAPFFKQQFFDDNGVPLAGGKVYSYAARTSTPLNTFSDESGLVPNANPVILDSSGGADIWLSTDLYKMVIADANDIVIKTVDNVSYASDGAVGTEQLADGSVTTVKLADLNVTTAKLADDAVTTDKIDEDAVQTANILDEAVTTPKIADGAITADKIANGAITQIKMGSLGEQLSASCGNYTYAGGGSRQDVTNLSGTITSTGRPIRIELVADTPGSPDYTYFRFITSSTVTFFLKRGATDICAYQYTPPAGLYIGSLPYHTDVVAAGTYTYKLQIAGAAADVNRVKLLLYEV